MKRNLKSALTTAAVIFGVGISCILVTSCEDKPRTLKEGVGDALDTRPNENLKDAGEDIKDAVKDAKEEIKDDIKR
jgi:gas vesicle protein